MIFYFDTSAFVPLLISEPGSAVAKKLWLEADAVGSSRLLHVEAAAALAKAVRTGRVSQDVHSAATCRLTRMFNDMTVLEVGRDLVDRASALADIYDLRGCDAVHCASAEALGPTEVTFVSRDLHLLRVCALLGISTADTNR